MSKTPFPHPLHIGTLEAFCHPAPGHLLSAPHVTGSGRESEVLAGNGYLAIRVSRGLWLDSDFAPPPADFIPRFDSLPWARFTDLNPEEWRPLADVRTQLFRKASLSPWLGHRVAPSPVWIVAESHRVRLSHLQLISRLPRAEVWCGHATNSDPLFLRFTAGIGIIARDATLHDPRQPPKIAFSILSPKRCPLSGDRMSR